MMKIYPFHGDCHKRMLFIQNFQLPGKYASINNHFMVRNTPINYIPLSSGGDFSASGKKNDKSVIIPGYLTMLFQLKMLQNIK
jgi:hypothetical protein